MVIDLFLLFGNIYLYTYIFLYIYPSLHPPILVLLFKNSLIIGVALLTKNVTQLGSGQNKSHSKIQQSNCCGCVK